MKRGSNKGFTLFELLAVLAILSIIAAIAVPRVMQTIKNARIEALKSNMQLIANSMQRYATEKELTSCIEGMFVINPTNAEVNEANGNGIFRYDGTLAGADPESIFNVQIDSEDVTEANKRAIEIEADYIEGGIPDHIRVIVYTDGTQGHIVVSYGDVDATPTDGTDDEILLLNGITPVDLGEDDNDTPYVIPKTFELESGEGHDHETEE